MNDDCCGSREKPLRSLKLKLYSSHLQLNGRLRFRTFRVDASTHAS